jgi:hypothetical protein
LSHNQLVVQTKVQKPEKRSDALRRFLFFETLAVTGLTLAKSQ